LVSATFSINANTVQLLVPDESVNAYKAANEWKNFIINSIPTNIDLIGTSKLFVYPNPVNDILTVKGVNLGTLISVYDINGRIIYSRTAKNKSEEINFEAFPKGTDKPKSLKY